MTRQRHFHPLNNVVHLYADIFLAKHVALRACGVRCLESDDVAVGAMELRSAQDPYTASSAIPGSRAAFHQRIQHADVCNY